MDAYLRFLRERIGHALIVAPVVGVAVRDEGGGLLLQLRAGEGTWGLPGGWMSPGENAEECARRECFEETGWEVEITGFQGLYTDPRKHTVTYPNGDRAQFVAMIFEARLLRRRGVGDAETEAIGFFAKGELPTPLHPPDVDAIGDALSEGRRPFVR